MWRLYVVSSASTRISPGSARLIARTNASSSTPPSARGTSPAAVRTSAPRTARLRPTRFSHVRLCDSFSPSDGATAERRPHQRVGDPVGVEAVARLVQRRPDRLEVVGPVAGRQADVPVRERRAERVRGRVEPPRARPSKPSVGATRSANARCASGGEVAVQERRVDLGRGGDELGQRRAQHGEHLVHLASSSSRARSRRAAACTAVGPLEALGVAALQLDVRRADTAGTRRSRRPARLDPRVVPARAACGVISTRSSVGTRRAFSQSRRVTRIRLASSES